MERLDFHALLLRAWRDSISKKFPWMFGFIVAVVSIVGTHLQEGVLDTASLEALIRTSGESSLDEQLWLLLILLFVVNALGKGNLIATLAASDKTSPATSPVLPRAVGRNFIRALLIESLALGVLFITIGILALPFWLASLYNPVAMNPLIILGFLTLIPITIIVFCIKQYALLYYLLSPLRIRGTIEVSGSLFTRFFSPSIAFCLFSFALTLLFTFFLNLVILNIAVLSDTVSLIASLVLLAWFAVFQQALWLAYFQSIAKTDVPQKITAEQKATFADSNLTDTPPA